MPPLPSTTSSLTNRLNALSESNKHVLQLIQRLSKLDFQPGSVPLNSEDGDVRLELSAEIHESLKQLEEDLELIRQEVEDIVQGIGGIARRRESAKENERNRLAVLLARLTEDLKSSRTQFRQAQLTAKRNADRAKLKERELLFSYLQSGSSTPSSTHRRKAANSQLTADELIVGAASDVTAGLRRTHQLMQQELSRSKFAQETLQQSTAALADLGEKYTDLNSLLANSKTLVNTLLKSTKSDTWYLETAFYILCATIIWLIFRRWLYGPLWWFVWVPIKFTYKITFAIFAAVGLTGGKPSTTSVQPTTSLIVKSSATGAIPTRVVDANQAPPYIPVGRGGGGGWGHDPSPPGSVSQKVGQMAEQNQQQDVEDHPQLREQAQQQEDQNEPVVRGDGTVLQESDRPRNPKKRIWEENVESAKHEQEQAQAQGEQQGQQLQESGRRKRDEL
ncbi:Sec20-domain-containing protein [Clohesyomyces aquaticus]|uniref:Sec20-domain-containing protein n=1 Tax=Clohesyomyces aquaticus TaxID=1231657 RepID=A0A1Y1ZD81_9PLEO|nr:Sec20-domain-containing protein [Clohesyomyces aquaticus]